MQRTQDQIVVSNAKRTSESITIANLRRSQKRKAAEGEHEEDIFEIEYPTEEHFKSHDRHPNIQLRFLLEQAGLLRFPNSSIPIIDEVLAETVDAEVEDRVLEQYNTAVNLDAFPKECASCGRKGYDLDAVQIF
jgi:hypothetical protein